jgi:hypothetical protein
MEKLWPIIWLILGTLGTILFFYAFHLSRRPEINSEVAQRSLQFREHCKIWGLGHDKIWRRYSFWRTNLATFNISGQGIILYSRRLSFAWGAAVLLFLTSYFTYQLSSLKSNKDQVEAFSDCDVMAVAEKKGLLKHQEVAKQEAFLSYSVCMFLSMAMSYVVLMIASVIFEYTQIRYSISIDENNSTHEDYALKGVGFPKDCTDPNEIHNWAQKILDQANTADEQYRIVGCSLAYDFKTHEEFINNAINYWVEELEVQFERKQRTFEKHSPRSPITHGTSRAKMQTKSLEDKFDQEKRRDCLSLGSIARLEFLDFFFWGSCNDEPSEDSSGPPDQEEVVEVLKNLQGSGFCYLIFDTPVALQVFKDLCTVTPAVFRDNHKVTIEDVSSEPTDLYWENFTQMNFWPRIMLGCLMILLTIALWVAMYMPYAMFTGARTSFLEGTLLGLIITVGNAIIAIVIDIITKWAGFRQKDRRDMTILSLALLSTLLNTVFDLWMVLRISKGVGASGEGGSEGSSEGFDHIVARELFLMIVPGYLILPYLVTPLVEHVLPYWLGLWIVRSRNTSLRNAEECLKCPEFDICWRYSDLHNNFTVCTLMLFTVSPHSYEVMFWLVVFLMLIYGIDKYKLLRQTSQTFYTTRRLSNAASMWWCVPTGVLAAVTAWWASRADILPSQNASVTCIIVFFVHCAMWLCLYQLAHACAKSRQEEIVETTPYKEMCETLHAEGMMWSYFSTNPIYCLRSKYLGLKEAGSDTFPCIPYVPGRQHLQPGAPDHYQTKERSHSGAPPGPKTLSLGLE